MKLRKTILHMVLPIILLVAGLYLFLYLRGGFTYNFGKTEYAETTAECTSVAHEIERGTDHSLEGRPNDKDQYSIIYIYSYKVNGMTYEASDRNRREFEDYESYQRDIEEEQSRIGDTKTIYYNPEKPDQYSFYHKNFKESFSSTNWVIIVVAVLCMVTVLPTVLMTGIITAAVRNRRK